MTGFYLFLLKATLSLGMVYGIYILCLRKLTFFQWNRWYLLLYSLMAFILPCIDINGIGSLQQITAPSAFLEQVPSVYHWVTPNITPLPQTQTLQQTNFNWSDENLLLSCMLFVSLLLFIRMGIALMSVYNITRNAEFVGYMNQCKILRVQKPISPFSFTNTIVLGNQAYEPDELEKILTHEMIHTRQRHSIDIIFSEILIILAWWNPFSWLIQKSIRQNLEFIADREVIKHGVDVHPYQMLLLKTMQNPSLRITNAFSFSHLKKRIMMMNVKPSHRMQLARFLLIAPAFILMLLLFRSPFSNAQQTASEVKKTKSNLDQSEIFAEINKEWEGNVVQSDTLYFGGLVIDEETGKPLPKFPINISLNSKTITTLHTDQNGKYFFAAPIPQNGNMSSFSWKLLQTEFAPGDGGCSIKDSATQPEFYVHLVAQKKSKRRSVSEPIEITYAQIREWKNSSVAILNSMAEKSASIFANYKELLAMEKEFISKNDTSNKTFILYNGWLYWKKMKNEPWSRLEKPENLILKLAEDTVTYEDINNWFATHERFIVIKTPAYKNKGSLSVLEFYTEPFMLPKPPISFLENGDYQAKSLANFKEELSDNNAVFVDGFRAYRNGQHINYTDFFYGNKNGIIIYKLTGDLAAYYSEKASVVWWIETKEAAKISNRPDFESAKKLTTLSLFQNGTIMPCNYGLPDRVTVSPELLPITVVFTQQEPVYSLTSGKVVAVFEISKTQLTIVKHSNGNYITYGNLQNVKVKKGDMVSNNTELGLPKINEKGAFSITLQYDTPEGAIGCKNCIDALKKVIADDQQFVKNDQL
jgi:hypothetical protein